MVVVVAAAAVIVAVLVFVGVLVGAPQGGAPGDAELERQRGAELAAFYVGDEGSAHGREELDVSRPCGQSRGEHDVEPTLVAFTFGNLAVPSLGGLDARFGADSGA